ncbi:hypothetical protein GOC18_24465 [Sinorhizobium meliloti]|uniref:hypothetical protein n=1 Tax=Rhizobium meliloti TaxID=382 RepID=UPI00299E56BA|nr:hypothetical protein [Sinorhizobium meliloti]
MFGRYVHWIAKTLALLMLIAVAANPCPPGSAERETSDGQILASFRATQSETKHRPLTHGDHSRGLSHCHGDAATVLSPFEIIPCKEKGAFPDEVALFGSGHSPKVTLRPPIARA